MRNCSDSVIIIYLRSRCLRENTKYSLKLFYSLKNKGALGHYKSFIAFSLDFICHMFFHWLSGTEIGGKCFLIVRRSLVMNHVIFDGEFSFFLSPPYLSFSRPSTHSIDFKFK